MLESFSNQMLELCLEAGMQLPLHMVAISANGAVIVFKVVNDGNDRTECTVVCENHSAELAVPVTITLIGADGFAACGIVEFDGENARLSVH